jgi:hypothetical protein
MSQADVWIVGASYSNHMFVLVLFSIILRFFLSLGLIALSPSLPN